MGRAPEPKGFEGWNTWLQQNGDLAGLFKAFVASPEFRAQSQYRRKNVPSSRPKHYFVHIPKTAGTALRAFLSASVPADDLFSSFYMDDLLRSTDSLASYTYFTGHFQGMLDVALNQKTRKATLLRHPVQRTISHFFHYKRDPESIYHKLYKDVEFEDMPAMPESRQVFGNYQAKYLHTLGFGNCALQFPIWEWAETFYPENPRALFESASRILREEIELVGLSEEHEAFCLRLAQAWNLPASGYVFRANEAPNKKDVSRDPALLKQIEEWNDVDMEIYQLACHDLVPRT